MPSPVGGDETGARIDGRTPGPWVFAGRGGAVAQDGLGGQRPAVRAADRSSAQRGLGAAHQVCPAPILRAARAALDDGDAVVAPQPARLLARSARSVVAFSAGRRRSTAILEAGSVRRAPQSLASG